MKAITTEQLEQVIEAVNEYAAIAAINLDDDRCNRLTKALTTLRDLPELKFHYIKDHPAGFTSTQQRHIWEKQMEKMKEKKG